MSSKELGTRCKRCLCFNYDEKVHCGHKCASKVFLLIAKDDDDGQEDHQHVDHVPNPQEVIAPTPTQISLHTLSDHLAPKTLYLLGQIAYQQVIILIDGGSTHNFVQEHLVHTLGLPTQPTTPLWVMVGNGHQLDCHLLNEAVTMHI